jgi:hypothetical protein
VSEEIQFVAKVSKVKSRTKNDKEYFTFRLNIPNELARKLNLDTSDYLFVKSAMKAKWYNMLNWKEMDKTWNMLPQKIQQEIQSSGMITVPQTNINTITPSITSNPWKNKEDFAALAMLPGITTFGIFLKHTEQQIAN